jgi:hypothetical protein
MGETETAELAADDFTEYQADFGLMKLPQGFESTELRDASGNLVGKLTFAPASGGQADPASSNEPAVPTEVTALKSEVQKLKSQLAQLSAKSTQPDTPADKGAPESNTKSEALSRVKESLLGTEK